MYTDFLVLVHFSRRGGAFNEEDQKDRGLVGMRLERCVSLLALPTPMLVHSRYAVTMEIEKQLQML